MLVKWFQGTEYQLGTATRAPQSVAAGAEATGRSGPQFIIGMSTMRGTSSESLQSRIDRYLKIETLLNQLFSTFDFCRSRCIPAELRKNGNRPVAACCTRKYHCASDLTHPAYELLKEQRERHYGRPEDFSWSDPVSPCEYHNPTRGCMLPTHKSPVCLAFICPEGIDSLRNHYGIYGYDFCGVYYALEWILTGDLQEKEYLAFKAGIVEMTRRIDLIRNMPAVQAATPPRFDQRRRPSAEC